jgi:excisionase family DNA binding protein
MTAAPSITRAGFSVTETAQALGVSTSAVYQAIRSGDIDNVRVGGKVYVPAGWFSKKGLDVPSLTGG